MFVQKWNDLCRTLLRQLTMYIWWNIICYVCVFILFYFEQQFYDWWGGILNEELTVSIIYQLRYMLPRVLFLACFLSLRSFCCLLCPVHYSLFAVCLETLPSISLPTKFLSLSLLPSSTYHQLSSKPLLLSAVNQRLSAG